MLVKVFALAAVVALATVVDASSVVDKCAQFPTCDDCVAQPLCGWCSSPVVYPGNITGAQCAGFEPNKPTPFACNGVYSTETCSRGYKCDQETFQCVEAAPGEGTSKDLCERNCTNNGQIYLCNHTTKKCYEVPAGTPDAKPMAQCMAECVHPSPHPAPPPPSQTPAPLFACNHSTGNCEAATAGKGEAKSVCEAECKKITGHYLCNKFLHKCEKAPDGVPGGTTLTKCEEECDLHPHPHPPSTITKGLYRGIQIQKGYTVGAVDFNITEDLVTFAMLKDGAVKVWWSGIPSHVPSSSNSEMWINVTSSSVAANVGQVIKTISLTSGQPGPQTAFMTSAMGSVGGPAPADVKSAMTDEGFTVFAFARCQTPQCIFTFPSISSPRLSASVRSGSKITEHDNIRRAFTGQKKTIATIVEKEVKETFAVSDHCSQYASSCSECIAHQFCGWCSVNVTYKDGSQGTQCAGFNNDKTNSSAAFVCAGRYSTLNCDAGWECNTKTLTCSATSPGNGMKSKKICEQFCHATPPPTPKQKQYVCNTTLKQCFPCNTTHCSGSMPQGPCEAACVHPKHGPHSALIGIWRGIYIQNNYNRIEVEMYFNKSAVTIYHSGKYAYWANVTSFGADAMIFEVMDGHYKGWKYGTTYQTSSQPPNNLFQMITLAAGKYGQGIPQGYSSAMTTQGMREYVLAKCENMPCDFVKP